MAMCPHVTGGPVPKQPLCAVEGTEVFVSLGEDMRRAVTDSFDRMWREFAPAVRDAFPDATSAITPGLDGRKAAEAKLETLLASLDDTERALLYRLLGLQGWTQDRARQTLEAARWWLG